MRLIHATLPFAASLILAALVLACGPTRGGGGGDDEGVGDPCTTRDAEEDAHICDGRRALECKTNDDGDLVWEIDEDCGASGQSCVSGECRLIDTGVNNGEGNNGNNGNTITPATCPDVSGTWTFEDHCEPSLIGTSYEVFQTGCNLTVSTVGWTGFIESDGAVTISGPIDETTTLTCEGHATETRLEASCVPTCDVVLVR